MLEKLNELGHEVIVVDDKFVIDEYRCPFTGKVEKDKVVSEDFIIGWVERLTQQGWL